jgi:hypothetical protein
MEVGGEAPPDEPMNRPRHDPDGLDIDLDAARKIEAVCRRIEVDWRAGKAPAIGDDLDETAVKRFDTEAAAAANLVHSLRPTALPRLAGPDSCPTRQVGGRTQTTPFDESPRASVGSTEAAKDVVARFGQIDRSTWEVPSRLEGICTRVTFDS